MIRFSNFWPGFKPEESFFASLEDRFSLDPRDQIEISSVFKPSPGKRLIKSTLDNFNPHKKNADAYSRKIWYTGENTRPPLLDTFNGFLSFDQDSFGGKNAYLPLVYVAALDSRGDGSGRLGAKFKVDDLVRRREPIDLDSKNFMCAFINNPDPIRMKAIEEFSKLGKVDVFGKVSGRSVDSKFDVARDYKYSLCFENDLYPGYITEKPLEAYLCGTIPIYWGDFGSEKHLNQASLINYRGFSTLKEMVEFVASISQDELTRLYSEPLFKSVPDLADVARVLRGEF